MLLYILNFSFAHLQKLNYEISEFKIYRANNKPTKTLEQREAEYAEARKRILGSTSSTEVKEETIITNNRCVCWIVIQAKSNSQGIISWQTIADWYCSYPAVFNTLLLDLTWNFIFKKDTIQIRTISCTGSIFLGIKFHTS